MDLFSSQSELVAPFFSILSSFRECCLSLPVPPTPPHRHTHICTCIHLMCVPRLSSHHLLVPASLRAMLQATGAPQEG